MGLFNEEGFCLFVHLFVCFYLFAVLLFCFDLVLGFC